MILDIGRRVSHRGGARDAVLERRRHFLGLGALVGGLFTDGATDLGIGAATAASIGSIAGPVVADAGVGALGSYLMGGSPATGALIGGALGGVTGAMGTGALGGSLFGSGSSTANSGVVDANSNLYTSADQAALASSGSNGGDWADVAGTSAPTTQAANNVAGKGLFGGSSGGINGTTLALGALAALGSANNKPTVGAIPNIGPAQVSANLGPLYNTGLNTNVPGRTQVNPYANGSAPQGASVAGQTSPYWTYGSTPQTYFTGNSLSNFGYAHGGPTSGALSQQRERSTAQGDHYIRGPGTATSDSIPAQLSDGEYVLDHEDVTRIGRGSNARGAKLLDRARKQLPNKRGALSLMAEAA
jgi:hypothetical protein